MAIQLSKKQSDLEKRLKLLHQQIDGKKDVSSAPSGARYQVSSNSHVIHTTDVVYLQQDLLKILTLSSLAIASQIALYYLLQHHILNLNFF